MAISLLDMKNRFPDPMRQGLVSVLWESSRVMQFVNFIEQKGMAYGYSEKTKLPGVAFRSLNETFTPTEGVTNPKVENLAILGGKIRTDSIHIDQKGPQVRSDRIGDQMEAAAKFFDKNFFKGDPKTNPKAFLGLQGRLAGNQLITNAANGATPDYKNFIKALDAVEGDNSQKIIFCNRNVRYGLSLSVSGAAGGKRVMEEVVAQLTTFEGAKIVEVFKDETEADILDFNETCGNSNLCSSAYVVRFGDTRDEKYVQGISGLSEHIMHRGPFDYGEYLEDIAQMVAGIGLFSGYCAARIQGLTKT